MTQEISFILVFRYIFVLLCGWWMSLLMKCPLQKNSVFFKFPGWQFLLPPLAPSHVCHVALPPRGNKSMQQQGNTIECALYFKDKYTLKHKYKYLLPCSPKQCGSECLLAWEFPQEPHSTIHPLLAAPTTTLISSSPLYLLLRNPLKLSLLLLIIKYNQYYRYF